MKRMTEERPLSAMFVAIADYALRQGVKSINALPGCWEQQIDEQWWIAVNGHREECLTSEGTAVPGFSAYVKYNGWPAGFVDPYGGTFAAGEGANEDTFLAALKGAAR